MSGMDGLDQLLADLPRHDASDALVDRVLLAVQAEQDEERLRADAVGARRRRRIQLGRWGALAAGVLLALTSWWAFGDRQVDDPAGVAAPGIAIKGTETPADTHITLGLSLLRNDVPVALEPGAEARRTDKVLLRYTTDREGFAYLFRQGDDGSLEIFHGTATLPGTHHVTIDGQIVGYGLDGLAGQHRFGVAWSPEPWAPTANGVARAPAGFAAAIAAGPFPRVLRGALQGVVVDSRPVQVGAP